MGYFTGRTQRQTGPIWNQLLEFVVDKARKEIEIINDANDNKEDLMQDFVAIITSFCARLYGLRRSKRKTEKIIKELAKELAAKER